MCHDFFSFFVLYCFLFIFLIVVYLIFFFPYIFFFFFFFFIKIFHFFFSSLSSQASVWSKLFKQFIFYLHLSSASFRLLFSHFLSLFVGLHHLSYPSSSSSSSSSLLRPLLRATNENSLPGRAFTCASDVYDLASFKHLFKLHSDDR